MSEKKQTKKAAGQPAPARPTGPMDVELLERIVKLMESNDLNTVDLRDGDRRVILKRGATQSAMPQNNVVMPQPHPSISASAASASTPRPSDDANLIQIKSPMVGTFYVASSPDAKPFVGIGSTVSDETDVCVIEAMKVFNNVKAECSGTIAKILVTNGQAVEFGQTLFMVKP